MKTDRELLELAAKAVGMPPEWRGIIKIETDHNPRQWNPLTDDGDALRLAILLGIGVQYDAMAGAEAWIRDDRHLAKKCVNADDPNSATRRAIVRAAAAIAENMT